MIEVNQHIIPVSLIDISVEDVNNKFSGESGKPPQMFLEAAERTLKKVENLNVLFGYDIFPVKVNEEYFTVKDVKFRINKEVYGILKNSKKLAVFACSVSQELNEVLKEYDDDFVEHYINDVIGTLIIEKTGKYLYDFIKKEQFELKATNSLSPGNCGWQLESQKELFKLFPDNYLGIKLTESGMMIPLKSLSGVVGFGESVVFKHTDCRSCKSQNCMYRKVEYNGF